jgi:arylformamidase
MTAAATSATQTPLPWAGLTPEEHEHQYNPQRAFPDFARHGAARAPLNEQARRTLNPDLHVRYGDHALRTLDIFRASGEGLGPVHVFFHGGYWRAQDKQNFAFIAGVLVPLGITTVIVNYELCPDSTLDGVVDSALSAYEWTARNIQRYGGDARRIGVSGHSAGAHLVAEILATDWTARGIAGPGGATVISGIFDPAPAMRTTVNEQLRLTTELAQRHDVERRPLQVKCPIAIVAGGLEPEQWVDQSFRYYHHVRRQGVLPELHVLEGHDHFGILADFLEPRSVTLQAILGQLARSPE